MVYKCFVRCRSNNHGEATVPAFSLLAITCSKLTVETLEQGVKYVQS